MNCLPVGDSWSRFNGWIINYDGFKGESWKSTGNSVFLSLPSNFFKYGAGSCKLVLKSVLEITPKA
jgi:hypothetical protein